MIFALWLVLLALLFGLVVLGPRMGRRGGAAVSQPGLSADGGNQARLPPGEVVLVSAGLVVGAALWVGAMWWLIVGFTSAELFFHQSPDSATPQWLPGLLISLVFGAAGLGVGLPALRRLRRR